MKILVIQNRMGIGDTVIFLPFIKAISQKYQQPISLLVKENSKANQYLKHTSYIKEIISLERYRNTKGRHDGINGFFRLIKDIKSHNFKKVFIFNSSLRYRLISVFAGINNIYQYPLFQKKKQHIIKPAINLIKKNLNINVKDNPEIQIDEKLCIDAKLKYKINENEINILLGIGGSGPTKRIPAKTFLKVIEKMLKKTKCKFFLATGKNENEQKILKEILNSNFNKNCFPLDNFSIEETLPIINNCNISICNDSSFSHLSSALGIKTIVLMADTPLIYGSYSSIMYPIIPDGETTVNHNTLGKEKINPDKIYNKLISLIY